MGVGWGGVGGVKMNGFKVSNGSTMLKNESA